MHRLSLVNTIALGIIGALTTTVFGMYVAQIAYILKDGPGFGHVNLLKDQGIIAITLAAVYLVTTIYAAAIGFISLLKARTLVGFNVLAADPY